MNTNNENELAKLALEHNLYVEGWQMKNLYLTMDQGGLGMHVLDDNEPVAACVVYLDDGMINVFVKESYRGKGYGKKVVEQTLEKYKLSVDDVYGCAGADNSEQFYNSCDIAYFADGCFSMKKEEVPLLIEGKITMKDVKARRIFEYKQGRKYNRSTSQVAKNTIEYLDMYD